MSDDSGDLSDNVDPRPSGSKCRGRLDQKKKRRIVMRIEFDDSEEETTSSAESSSAESECGNNKSDELPSCSLKNKPRRCSSKLTTTSAANANDVDYDSDQFRRNTSRRRLNRRTNVLTLDGSSSDGSSSGSEIIQRVKPRGKIVKKFILSEDERDARSPPKQAQNNKIDDPGFTSDSSSNELLEKCPICLLTFRQQEIGSPATCAHIFCANCIEAWSKNVQTCPIDRNEFDKIIVRESFENRRIVREINVDKGTSSKELQLDNELENEEDVTNCEICNSPDREDVMLLCDNCNQGYHIDCLTPPLNEIPEGSWYCDNCFDSQDEDDDDEVEEDLSMLYEDIRDMGISEAHLRVTEVHQPRILRTRQNERIRAAILRRTRAALTRAESTTTTTTTTTRSVGRPRNSLSTTTTTTTTTRTTRKNKSIRKTTKGRLLRRRRARQRTYVVEYDLNNFDEKFAIKTTKKVIRRRRRKQKTKSTTSRSKGGQRMTASQRLAEQMGVKRDRTYINPSHAAGTSGLSIFGNANDLEYFSESDREIDSEIQIDSGHGTAIQTSVRISNIGPQRSRKGLLLGRLQRNTSAVPSLNVANTAPDILSNILDLQDRWHSASQNLENVHISTDGILNFNDNDGRVSNNSEAKQNTEPKPNDVTQAPMYPQGGGNQRYNNSGGGYHNNNFGNQSNYRNSGGGSGGNNQYRNSTGGMNSSGSGSNMSTNFNMVGRGNFNFSSPAFSSNQNQNTVFSPFNNRDRFNQRNQQQQNNNMNQRNSLPYSNNLQQHRQPPQIQQNSDMDNQLFGGLPPPVQSQNESQLFSGLPPPTFGPQLPTQHQVQQQLPDLSVPPPVVQPVISTAVPPPPAPPAALTNWNSSLFSYAQDEDDDDSNCPNFSVYSAESQEVAKASENKNAENDGELPKEDDENEDLVQLDDDDDIPMPPENNSNNNSDLYEPENPTDEIDNDSKHSNKEISGKTEDITDTDTNKNETQQKDNNELIGSDSQVEEVNSQSDEIQKDDDADKSPKVTQSVDDTSVKPAEDARSPSPAVSEIKAPDAEGTAANRKGVLELYDDSDWDELDIERPKSIERGVVNDNVEGEDASNQKEEDRSYTPCLDEKNDPEDEPAVSGGTPEMESETAPTSENVDNNKTKNDVEDSAGIAGMETELISDDEDHEGRNGKRQKDKRGKRDHEKSETFKKVSSKQKERNYRTDKGEKRNERRRSSRPKSRSNSGSRSRSRNRSRSRSGSRLRQKSPRGSRRNRRRKSRTPQRHYRSRSRSNDKENMVRMRGGRRNFNSRQARPKRRELPRYNVRNVVGQPRNFKDRYGRDTSRPNRNSRSLSHTRRRRSISKSRSRSLSPKRNRRNSFSISPSPPATFNRRSPRRSPTPRARRSPIHLGRRSPSARRNSSQLRLSSPLRLKSRSASPTNRVNGRKVTRRIQGSPAMARLRSISHSPRYTPRLSRSRSRSQSLRLQPKGKKKKLKENKKKKMKKRDMSKSPVRRMSRQRDPYADEVVGGNKRKRHRTPPVNTTSPLNDEPTWSPSPSPPPIREYDNNVSWTPPIQSPPGEFPEMFTSDQRRGGSKTSKKGKRKREKKKKKIDKRREVVRKEKRRARRTETPEPAPSKEVFASGNNILVSVSFNKDAANQPQPQQQTTVVTLPPTREDLLTGIRRPSQDRQVNVVVGTKKKKDKTHKRKKLDTKPVAIIDLERSPFQVHQEPADIIVLTDSEGGNDDDDQEREHHRDRHMSESGAEDTDHHHRVQIVGNSGGRAGSHHDKTPPMLDNVIEEQYEIQQTGPKTPPEPPVIKFTLLSKKQTKTRNPLHEEDDLNDDLNMGGEQDQQHRQEIDTPMHVQGSQKIGPNTPPESGPCSPDVYDPFDPTKSPSLSPRSPTPPPLDISQNSISDSGPDAPPQKHNTDEQRLSGERLTQQLSTGSGSGGAMGSQSGTALNPVELVMALMNSKQPSNSQDLANKSLESQYSASSSHMLTGSSLGAGHDDSIGGSAMHDKSDDGNSGVGGLSVLSNVLLSSGKSQQSQHIPTISSPTPVSKSSQISKLPLPKVVAGSVGSSGSGIGLPSSGSNLRNGAGADDSFNDIESPYSPGSADYEDLFEPPPDNSGSKRRPSKRPSGKAEVYDNLFGSSSPVGGQVRLPSYTPSAKKHKSQPAATSAAAANSSRKSKIVKVVKSGDDHIKVYDDVPNSAVELQVKDKFLRKLNRQERVVEEVKLILKPRFNKKQITKDDYKEIMRRAVPKICHSRSGEINPNKIKNLIEAYVKKFRSKHKKLNIINTGQVSSAVKCAAYLKKL